jgi:AcrR family transcriptional regulator
LNREGSDVERKTAERVEDDRRTTHVRLIETAIHLLGERGVYGASLREISEKAGAKNTAAAHYHFGDRRGLIVASLELVVQDCSVAVGFDKARQLGLIFTPRKNLIWRILAQSMLPFVTLPMRRKWGYNGIRLLSRLLTVEGTEFAPDLETRLQPGEAELVDLLAVHLPEMAPDILRQRLGFMFVSCICGTAAFPYTKAVTEAGLANKKSSAEFFTQLTDYVAGGVLAVNLD